MEKRVKIPDPTVSRLPIYFRCLAELQESGVTIVSSGEIASRAGIKASQFRKDLSYFGEFGIQGLGYPVEHLLRRIASIMQLDRQHKVVLVGAGNLGSALANFPGFARWGFEIVHIFDADPSKVGNELGGLTVCDIAELPQPLGVDLGVLAVPAAAAQGTAELLTKCGVKAILNFTGRSLGMVEPVVVRNVDLTHELAILAYHLASSSAP